MSDLKLIRLIAGRVFAERLRSRAFQVSTGISLVIVLGLIIAPQLFGDDGPDAFTIGLLDTDAAAQQAIEATAPVFDAEVTFADVADRDDALVRLEDGDLDGVVEDGQRLLVFDEAHTGMEQVVETALQQRTLQQRLDAAGIAPAEAADLLAPAEVEVVALSGRDGEDVQTGQGIALFGIILLFISVTTSAGFLLMGTVEEKSSRVVEVLLGAVRPWHLLAGKLAGMGALALGQFALIVAAALTAVVATDAVDLPATTASAVVWTLVWLVLGYAFYATFFAVAGALASSMEDAQSTAGPINILLLAAYLASIFVVGEDPNSIAAVVLSILPPFAPLAMPARIATGAAAPWEVALALGLMVPAIYGTIRLAGRLYAEGLLRTGGRVKVREIWRSDEIVGA